MLNKKWQLLKNSVIVNIAALIKDKSCWEDKVGPMKLRFLCKIDYEDTDLQIRNVYCFENQPLMTASLIPELTPARRTSCAQSARKDS